MAENETPVEKPTETPVEAPKAGTPEYEEAMAKLAEERLGSETPEETPEEHTKPEGIPDKYWNAETGAVDYASMQKETEYWKNKAEGKSKETPEEGEEKPKGDEAEEALESKGLSMDDYQNEYSETGELSEKSYKELEDAGIPKEMVDAFIAGQEAIATTQRAELLKDVGGEEGFQAMAEWMGANLSEAELTTYNELVASDNTDVVKNAISNMNTKYQAAVGNGGEMINGDMPSESKGGYESRSEFVAAMNDPRYGKDGVYTKSVEDKMKATPDEVFRQR